MSISDAFVRVSCDGQGCREELEVELRYTYGGFMHTVGVYDGNDATITRDALRQGWSYLDGKHYCEDCASREGD